MKNSFSWGGVHTENCDCHQWNDWDVRWKKLRIQLTVQIRYDDNLTFTWTQGAITLSIVDNSSARTQTVWSNTCRTIKQNATWGKRLNLLGVGEQPFWCTDHLRMLRQQLVAFMPFMPDSTPIPTEEATTCLLAVIWHCCS